MFQIRKHQLWLLPIGFVLHDGEEMLTMPHWITAHQADLAQISNFNWATRLAVATVPKTAFEIAMAIALEALVIIAVTAAFSWYPRSRMATYAFSGLLGVFVAHSVTHAIQPIIFRRYTPGAVSGMTVIPILGVILYRHLFAAKLLNPRTAVAATIIGALVFMPLFGGIVSIARMLAGG
jgi:hypothetical protein